VNQQSERRLPAKERRPANHPNNSTQDSTAHAGTLVLVWEDSAACEAFIRAHTPIFRRAIDTPGPLPVEVEELRTQLALARIQLRRLRAAEAVEQLAGMVRAA
jgi:hypothetical protein